MEEISNKSCFLRMKERLAIPDKPLLIDKSGCYTQKQTFDVFCGVMNELKDIVSNTDICLISSTMRKETAIIVSAVLSLGAAFMLCEPHASLEDYYSSIKNRIKVKVFIDFIDEKWVVKKDNLSIVLSLKEQELRADPILHVSKDKPAFYVLTSGSTGANNIVVLSEYAYINHIVRELDDAIGPNHQCTYCCVPLNHVFGIGLPLQHMLTGNAIYISDSRNPDFALEMIEKYQCSSLPNVPTFFYMLIEALKNNPRDISSLKYGVIAGGAYTPEQFKTIERELKISLCSSYGMTEACSVITNSPPNEPLEERCSGVGKPFDGVDVIFKKDNGEINPNEGEICFKGYNMMLGYLQDGKIILPVDKDGYFHTGDIGMKDEKGIYHVIGRKKNIIIRGGENLSPLEIEKHILSMGGIKDVVVVGIPNKKYGEVVAAYIASDVYKTTDEVEMLLKKTLPKNEVPYALIIDDNIPLLSNGKHDRITIRNIFISRDANK